MGSELPDDTISHMSLNHSLTRLISRCLIAVLLLQVALPSCAAFGTASKAGWMEICASSGIQWVKLAQPDGALADHQTAHDHCLLCASTGAAPDFDARDHLNPQLRHEAITIHPQAAHRWYAGHSILSRAPPA